MQSGNGPASTPAHVFPPLRPVTRILGGPVHWRWVPSRGKEIVDRPEPWKMDANAENVWPSLADHPATVVDEKSVPKGPLSTAKPVKRRPEQAPCRNATVRARALVCRLRQRVCQSVQYCRPSAAHAQGDLFVRTTTSARRFNSMHCQLIFIHLKAAQERLQAVDLTPMFAPATRWRVLPPACPSTRRIGP